MRVIAGSLRGRRLVAPPEGTAAIRPTSDRAREALFSILEARCRGGFVDLYAGTGAVALEAHSRGWAPVTCVERQPAPCLLRNLAGTGVALLRRPVERLGPESFRDLAVVFADPPYDLAARAWEVLAPVAASWLGPGGLLVLETSSRESLPERPGWNLQDRRDYGEARFHFFVPA
ncbi:MAG: RsmD family RNA methyltransferase [Holophagaceae bacterium]